MVDEAETLKTIRRQRENIEWINQSLSTLRRKHGGRYVVVRNRKLIDSDKDFEALLSRVRKLAERESVTVEYITEREYLWLLQGHREGPWMRSRLLLTEKGIEVVARFTCPAAGISETFHFIIDTGSERSFLGWEDAIKAELEVEQLPASPKPVLGFGGGAAEAKHLREPCFLYVPFDSVLQTVELPDGILIPCPSRTRTKAWKAGASLSIVGRDVLIRSGWKFVVDLARGELYLEKP